MKKAIIFLFVLDWLPLDRDILYAQWIQTNGLQGITINSIVAFGADIFAASEGNGVFITTDDGSSWKVINNGLTDTAIMSLVTTGTSLFAGTGNNGVFLSTDNGSSWRRSNTGLTDSAVSALAVSEANLYVGTRYGGVFHSTDSGATWMTANNGLVNTMIRSLFANATSIYAGTYYVGLWRSTDYGSNWSAMDYGTPGRHGSVSCFAVNSPTLFAGTMDWYLSGTLLDTGGVFKSTDNGISWIGVNSGLTNTYVYCLAASGLNLFAGTHGGVFLSTNNGTSWSEVNLGLASIDVFALAVGGTNLFAGTLTGVWRRPLSQMITSVEAIATDLPTHFSLGQNYPNPFNPLTAIPFTIPSISFVSLKVFDVLGRESAVLLSDELEAGKHTRQWEATGLASGVYFYRLQAGDFVQTKKLLLLR